MKVALLGNGKTGSFVEELHGSEKTTVFNRSHLPNLEELQACDVAISFLPGEAFVASLPLLMESRIPVLSGSTGNVPFEKIDTELKEKKLGWIQAGNFSLAMTVIKSLLEKLSTLNELEEFNLSLLEKHHTKKLDAPSGTALAWKEWLGNGDYPIKSIREGDIVGFHSVTLSSEYEEICISHTAHNRKLFAQGALWGAQRIFKGALLEPGLHSFQNFVAKEISK